MKTTKVVRNGDLVLDYHGMLCIVTDYGKPPPPTSWLDLQSKPPTEEERETSGWVDLTPLLTGGAVLCHINSITIIARGAEVEEVLRRIFSDRWVEL